MKLYIAIVALLASSVSAFATPVEGSFTCPSTMYIGNTANGKTSVTMVITSQDEASGEKQITVIDSNGQVISELTTNVKLYMGDSMYKSVDHPERSFTFGPSYDGSLAAGYEVPAGSAGNTKNIDIISQSCQSN